MEMIKGKRYLIGLLFFIVFLLILINVFPRYYIEGFDLNDDSIDNTINQETKLFNNPNFADYDFKVVNEDNYLVSYSNSQFYCYADFDEVCLGGYSDSSSQISLYDNEYELIWSLGGYSQIDKNIPYNNYQFHAYAVDMIENGNTIAFGRTVNLDNDIFANALLVISPIGEIIQQEFVDTEEYGYDHLGIHDNYEIVNTDDGGFTIKYSELHDGILLIHYSNALEKLWHLRIEEGIEVEHIDTLHYKNGNYYYLASNKITCLNADGTLKWETTPDFTVSGFNLHNREVLVTGNRLKVLYEQDSLFQYNSEPNFVRTITTESLSITDGDTNWSNRYTYDEISKDNNEATTMIDINLVSRDIIVDKDNNYYVISYDTDLVSQQKTLRYDFHIQKFNPNGDYIGYKFISGNYERSFSYQTINTLDEIDFKLTFTMEDDKLVIYSPTTLLHRVIELDSEGYTNNVPISFDIISHNKYIKFRTSMNIIIITTLFITSIGGMYIWFKSKK
ncbi:hypothetical protein KQ51_01210 [Candidatus Izimaplasma bacterium HR1]|jgi:hypothetical protein|uniref:hypothetical protein n=1 Tax=Candidatus Izimoplasma sp. HR1 TaxID=1541959 RepID=UPI0004F5C595|nr:hypothetical protein KQ51_01210 [Candidatus Izimaplasma bacterium HR1]